MFGVVFFAQRTFIALTLSLKFDFAIESTIIVVIILSNACYLYSAWPYLLFVDGCLDYLNSFGLLITHTLQRSLSHWTPEASTRYMNGIYYDGFQGLLLLINLTVVFTLIADSLLKKLKLRYLKSKFRANRKN